MKSATRSRRKGQELGVKVTDVRILRAELPAETSQAIYDRMTSERVREAKELRAQGFEVAQQIRSTADREKEILLSDALRDSQTVRGVADAESNQIVVAAFGRDPDFYDLYRTLQVYRAALTQGGPTLVLSPSSELLKYFAQAPKVGKRAASPPLARTRSHERLGYAPPGLEGRRDRRRAALFSLRIRQDHGRRRRPRAAGGPLLRGARRQERRHSDHGAEPGARRGLPGRTRRRRKGLGARHPSVGLDSTDVPDYDSYRHADLPVDGAVPKWLVLVGMLLTYAVLGAPMRSAARLLGAYAGPAKGAVIDVVASLVLRGLLLAAFVALFSLPYLAAIGAVGLIVLAGFQLGRAAPAAINPPETP